MILTGTSLTHLYILYMNIFLLLFLLNIMNLKQKIIFLLLYMSPNNSTHSNYFECEECQYHQKLCVMPVNAQKKTCWKSQFSSPWFTNGPHIFSNQEILLSSDVCCSMFCTWKWQHKQYIVLVNMTFIYCHILVYHLTLIHLDVPTSPVIFSTR